MTPLTRSERRWLIALLAVALILRVAYSLNLDAREPYTDQGGDARWYLDVGYRFIAGEVGVVVPSGPVYLLFAGAWQRLLGRAPARFWRFVSPRRCSASRPCISRT